MKFEGSVHWTFYVIDLTNSVWHCVHSLSYES